MFANEFWFARYNVLRVYSTPSVVTHASFFPKKKNASFSRKILHSANELLGSTRSAVYFFFSLFMILRYEHNCINVHAH